ncbi:MAG: tetratricopeptide repeat protein [Candidatus Sericytochromatia bacterium]
MQLPPHPVFTLLRIWAEGLAAPELLGRQLAQLPGVRQSDLLLGLALLSCCGEPLPADARELARTLAQDPEWLDRHQAWWSPFPVLSQQLAVQLAKAAALLHAEPPLALLLYDQALLLMPELAAAWYFRGLLGQRLGSWPQAAADLLAACRLQPDWLPAWQEAARSLLLAGQPEQALALMDEALATHPQQAVLWLTRGNLLQALGRLTQAEAAYRRSLELEPRQAGVWSNLGLVCQQLLQPDEARACYGRALALDPGLAELWNNLATLQLESGETQQAATSLASCLQLLPGYYPAWVNRGLLAAGQGQRELAQQLFAQARDFERQRPEAWIEAAALLFEQDRDLEAYRLLEQGIAQVARPGVLEMMQGRNLVLRHHFAAGQTLMQQAIAHEPERAFWRFLAEVGSPNACFCRPSAERRAYLAQLERLLPRWTSRPFAPETYLHESGFLLVDSLWSLAYLDAGPFKVLKQLYARCFELAAGPPPARPGTGPLRLGVLVTPGHEGIFVKLGLRLLAALPPERCEVLLLGDAARLGGQGLPTLALAPRVAAAAVQLRALELDLLYYWEVGSDMLNFFLPYFQPVPVQFTSWGTPATTGHPAIQYYLSSSRLEAPDAAEHYSETLLLMEELPAFFADPEPLAGRADREALGLPATGILCLCLNNPLKFTPEFLELTAQILAQEPSAHLVLLTSRQSWVNETLTDALSVLTPFQARVHWRQAPVPRAEFLNLIRLADIGLDTLGYSGGQVSHEALALGLPVITLPGPTAHTRLTLSRWQQLGLSDGVATDAEDYLRLVLALARDPEARADLRCRLLERRERLLDRSQAVDQFMDLLWQMAVKAGMRKAETS